MTIGVSQAAVFIFGLIICALSAWGIYDPEKIVKFVKGVMNRDFGIQVAVMVRVVLGVALILAAEESRFPVIFQALGWLAILAAVVIAFVGRERLQSFTTWFDQSPPGRVRLWLLFGIAFGGFLIYGAA